MNRLLTLGAVLVAGAIAIGAVGPALAHVIDALARLALVIGLLSLAWHLARFYTGR